MNIVFRNTPSEHELASAHFVKFARFMDWCGHSIGIKAVLGIK